MMTTAEIIESVCQIREMAEVAHTTHHDRQFHAITLQLSYLLGRLQVTAEDEAHAVARRHYEAVRDAAYAEVH